ncbi:hypothetical protein A9G34_00775 [Gilliamella sp. Choc4-2]|jgi:predicted DNA-binding transcriptional regulator AlpA|uniref:helix-turn-helix transcriptional regulator n=1 Tax=unclassified Gilliamella TaxID=2685620 RepID=UPI00080E9D0E|nr:hypothetical protein [Gilliamella apicola]OCG45666.1 hypothetical protein A9G34_00775 [Gilliamella apicola]OCG58676.1 hypothetical protein A9G40_09395 [Gilliamella apicola]OCG62446.1 hypothetical protein A9G48_08520 [Gilliamella apicola]OCG69805.1 hypothetical protein A9G41_05785 [Gilliamella apicola]
MLNNLTIEDPRYSKAQVCSYLGELDQTTLDKWVAKEKFPKPDLYLGRHPRWKLSTINAYLAQKEQEYQSCG